MTTLDQQLNEAMAALKMALGDGNYNFTIHLQVEHCRFSPHADQEQRFHVIAVGDNDKAYFACEHLSDAVHRVIERLARPRIDKARELREQAQKLIAQAAELEGK